MSLSRTKTTLDIAVSVILLLIALWVVVPHSITIHDQPQDPGNRGASAPIPDSVAAEWLADGQRAGAVDAPVRIIEFGNLLCGHCARFHAVMDSIKIRYPGLVSLTWLHFVPSKDDTDIARRFAMAAECAGEQGRFADFVAAAFAADVRVGTQEQIRTLAEAAKIDSVRKLSLCVDRQDFATRVDQQSDQARGWGFNGTPTWILDGEVFVGAPSFSILDSIVVSKLRPTRK